MAARRCVCGCASDGGNAVSSLDVVFEEIVAFVVKAIASVVTSADSGSGGASAGEDAADASIVIVMVIIVDAAAAVAMAESKSNRWLSV